MGADVRIRPATHADALRLADTMRAEDVEEVRALGFTREQAILDSMKASVELWTWEVGGEVGAIFGVSVYREGTLLTGRHGVVWALTGTAVWRHRKAFVRDSRGIVRALLTRWVTLRNAVDDRYAGAVRWLRWLGAEVGPAIPFGPEGVAFRPFLLQRGVPWVQ